MPLALWVVYEDFIISTIVDTLILLVVVLSLWGLHNFYYRRFKQVASNIIVYEDFIISTIVDERVLSHSLKCLWGLHNFYYRRWQRYRTNRICVYEDLIMAHPTFRVMQQSCCAYSLRLKHLLFLKPYSSRFITLIWLFIPPLFPVEMRQSHHAII